MIKFTEQESLLNKQIEKLKKQAGSHSPSLFTFTQKLSEIKIKVDACFLSNPYATELFLHYFNEEVINTGNIKQSLESYPSQNSVIAEILGNFLRLSSENVFIGNGAIEIIQAIIHNFTVDKIIVNIPTFSSYYEFIKEGTQVIYNRLNKTENYELNVDDYIDLVKEEQPDTVVLINPNNPNGAYIKYSDIKRILDAINFVNTIIIDESFIHFAYETENFELVSVSKLIQEYPNLIIIKSMSKDFGIAGVRAGYGIMNKERVKALLNNGFLWNSNGIAEYFFRLYTRADFTYDYEKIRVKYIIGTMEFIKSLEKIQAIKVYPSKANFILIELPDSVSSIEFVSFLLIRYGIYVRTCNDKIGLDGEFIRLASRTKSENDYILNCFKEIFS